MFRPDVPDERAAVDALQILVRLKLELDLVEELDRQVVSTRDDADAQVVVFTQSA